MKVKKYPNACQIGIVRLRYHMRHPFVQFRPNRYHPSIHPSVGTCACAAGTRKSSQIFGIPEKGNVAKKHIANRSNSGGGGGGGIIYKMGLHFCCFVCNANFLLRACQKQQQRQQHRLSPKLKIYDSRTTFGNTYRTIY